MTEHIELAAVRYGAAADGGRVVHPLANALERAGAIPQLERIVLDKLGVFGAINRNNPRQHRPRGRRGKGREQLIIGPSRRKHPAVFGRSDVRAQGLGGNRAVIADGQALQGVLVRIHHTARNIVLGTAEHIQLVAHKRRLHIGLRAGKARVRPRQARAHNNGLPGCKVELAHVVLRKGHKAGIASGNLLRGVVIVLGRHPYSLLSRRVLVFRELGDDRTANKQQPVPHVHQRSLVRHALGRNLVGKVGPRAFGRVVREQLLGGKAAVVAAGGRPHHQHLAVPQRAADVCQLARQACHLRPGLRIYLVAPNPAVQQRRRLLVVPVYFLVVAITAAEHVERAVERGHGVE